MAARGAPRRVAVLGGGDGLAAREILRPAQEESVTWWSAGPHRTRLFVTPGGALRSSSLQIVNTGAFSWPPLTRKRLDAIVADFLHPTSRFEKPDTHACHALPDGLRFPTVDSVPGRFDFPRELARGPADMSRWVHQAQVTTREREGQKVQP